MLPLNVIWQYRNMKKFLFSSKRFQSPLYFARTTRLFGYWLPDCDTKPFQYIHLTAWTLRLLFKFCLMGGFHIEDCPWKKASLIFFIKTILLAADSWESEAILQKTVNILYCYSSSAFALFFFHFPALMTNTLTSGV